MKLIKGIEQKLIDVIQKNDLKESVKENDLRSLVHNEVSIDHKSKLGKDEKVIVLGIKVKDKDPQMI